MSEKKKKENKRQSLTSYTTPAHPETISQRKYDCLPWIYNLLKFFLKSCSELFRSKLHDSWVAVNTLDITAVLPAVRIRLLRVSLYCYGMCWLGPHARQIILKLNLTLLLWASSLHQASSGSSLVFTLCRWLCSALQRCCVFLESH